MKNFVWQVSDIKELQDNYLDERSSRWMYLALSHADTKLERAELLKSLASYEEKHAVLWEG